MPRSWFQTLSGRLKRWFWGFAIGGQATSVTVALDCSSHPLPLHLKAHTFGGVFWTHPPTVQRLGAQISTQTQQITTQWPHVGCTFPVAFAAPRVTLGTFDTGHVAALVSTLPTQLVSSLGHQVPPILPGAQSQQWLIPHLPPTPRPSSLSVPPLKFRVGKGAVSCRLRTKTQKRSAEKFNLPILRKPTRFESYPLAMRKAFRSQLAQKAGLPPSEVTVKGIYDRLYLGLFQTLSHGQAGELVCSLRPVAQIPNTAVATVPMYLVVGHKTQQPGQLLQVVVPMSDIELASLREEKTP